MSELKNDASNVISALKKVRDGSQLGSALTSVCIIWIIAYNKALEFLPYLGAVFFAVFMVGLGLFILEGGLRTFLPFVFDEIFSFRFRRENQQYKKVYRGVFWVVLLGLCGLLAMGTGGTSWLGRVDMVEAATPPPTPTDLDKVRTDQESNLAAIRTDFDARIEDARRTERDRVKAALAQSRQLLEDAKNSKGATMRGLYQQGNGWAEKQLSKSIAKAKADGDHLLNAAKHKVDNLMAEKDAALTAEKTGQTLVFTEISEQNKTRQESYGEKFQRNTLMLGVFGVGCLVVFILVNLLLSFYRIISDEPTFQRKEGTPFRLPRIKMPQVAFGGAGYQPPPQPATMGYPTGGPSGNLSPNVAAFSGKIRQEVATSMAGGGPTPPPDTTGMSYQKRADRIANENLVRAAWSQFELYKVKPNMRLIAEQTGLSYRTVRYIVADLGLME